MSAPRSQWRQIEDGYGQVCDLIFAARDLVDAARHEKLQSTIINPRDPEFLAYLRSRLCRSSGENLLVIFCDNEGKYLIDEKMGWGSAHNVRLDVTHLFRRALAVDASSLVLAHNHPSGSCQPSDDDIMATRKLAEAGYVLGVEVVDHLIVTREKAYSMRAGGKF
ncbi:JAB domain-containing protein [Pontixanthobacter sp. CEM42]|uniref:JAB domain-containing protein n=1 Tax=Pontixanthobacter sp. CEM42 TaxID=2792077 RepID=UPI001ADF264D|nr:JAB domain-containing protein [Pontixanthobacter sp. CEM42]